jgi:uncharacterized membrane protein/Mg-chelatase subunit ChlD
VLDFLHRHSLWVYLPAGLWLAAEIVARAVRPAFLAALARADPWVVAVRGVLIILVAGAAGARAITDYRFGGPDLLWLLLLVPLVAALSMRSLAGLGDRRRLAAVVFRSACLVMLIIALADVQKKRVSDDTAVIILLDVSHSVPEELQREALTAINNWAAAAGPNDSVKLITFAGDVQVETPFLKRFQVSDLTHLPVHQDRTDLASAIRLAIDSFPPEARKRLVVISDGNQNLGDAWPEAPAAAARGIPIDAVTLIYGGSNEILVDSVRAPAQANEKETVDLTVGIRTWRDCRVRVRLFDSRDGDREQKISEPDEKNPWIEVDLAGGGGARGNLNTVRIPREVPGKGLHQWRVVVEPVDEKFPDGSKVDYRPNNNVGSAATAVQGNPEVLLVSTEPDKEAALIKALSLPRLGMQVTTITPDLLPPRAQLFYYDAIIFSNVPASAIPAARRAEIEQYVKDTGGGFVMIGGDESFGAGDWRNTPIEKVLPVNLDVKNIKVRQKGALVLVMHSMEMPEGNFWGLQIAEAAVKAISRLDEIGVIDYEHGIGPTNWVVPLQPKVNEEHILSLVRRMQMGDMPDFNAILTDAHFALSKSDAANKHVIIISDGDPAPPADALVAKYKQDAITISCVCVTPHTLSGGDLAPFKRIVDRTNRPNRGRFYVVDDNAARNNATVVIDGVSFPVQSAKMLPQIFINETKVIRRPLIVNDPKGFLPAIEEGSGSPLLEGIAAERMRPLRGFVMTTRKPDAAVPLVHPTEKSSDASDPILAHWQYGVGKSVAWTSDVRDKWSSDWVKGYPEFERLWEHIIRWVQRPKQDANVQPVLVREGDRARLTLTAVDSRRRVRQDLGFTAEVVRPDGTTREITLTPTAAGGFAGTFPITVGGTYFAVAAYRDRDDAGRAVGPMRYVRTALDVAYEEEYRTWAPNPGLMRSIAEATDGRALEGSRAGQLAGLNIFRREGLSPAESWQSLVFTWDVRKHGAFLGKVRDVIVNMPLPALLAVVFLIDVCIRRVMIDFRAIRRWAARLWGRATTAPQPAAAGAGMDALLSRRREVDVRLGAAGAGEPAAAERPPERMTPSRPPLLPRRPPPPTPGPTVDAPSTAGDVGSQPIPPQPAAEGGVNRLLAAKKRAREELDKKEKK